MKKKNSAHVSRLLCVSLFGNSIEDQLWKMAVNRYAPVSDQAATCGEPATPVMFCGPFLNASSSD